MSTTGNIKDWIAPTYKCKNCKDEIRSRYSGEFVSCKCGNISIDSTPWYTRFIGNADDFELIDEGAIYEDTRTTSDDS